MNNEENNRTTHLKDHEYSKKKKNPRTGASWFIATLPYEPIAAIALRDHVTLDKMESSI